MTERKNTKASAAGPAANGKSKRTGDAPPPSDTGPEIPSPAQQIAALSGDPQFMTSLARGLAVMRAFAQRRRSQTMADLSRKTGLPRAAVGRCLYTLEKLGYVESDGKSFMLRPQVLALGFSYLSSAPLTSTAQPFLERVSARVKESCSLCILDGDEIVYVARSATQRIMSVVLNVGSRLPAFNTAMGRVLLAHLKPDDLERYLRTATLRMYTEKTITAKRALKRLLATVRENGYSIVDQELEIGLRSIAVPVRNALGDVVAAINISVHAQSVSLREIERSYLPHLRAAADEMAPLIVGA